MGTFVLAMALSFSCGKGGGKVGIAPDAAQKVYVAPGDKGEVYLFASGGFNGQIGVHGIPSGRLFKIIPVFSVWTENDMDSKKKRKVC